MALSPSERRELLRMLTNIDEDGIDNPHELRTYEGVCLAWEAFGGRMAITGREWDVVKRLYNDQAPAVFDYEDA
jgi:hypothetical protein